MLYVGSAEDALALEDGADAPARGRAVLLHQVAIDGLKTKPSSSDASSSSTASKR